MHIDAQLSAQPGSSFYGLTGQQHEEVNLLGMINQTYFSTLELTSHNNGLKAKIRAEKYPNK